MFSNQDNLFEQLLIMDCYRKVRTEELDLCEEGSEGLFW